MTDKFYFYSGSKDVAPGKGKNEQLNSKNKYELLENTKDWRKMLSNFWVEPFQCEGLTWNTLEHYYHSRKFIDYPEFAKMFSLESESEFCRDPAFAKSIGGKSGKSKNIKYKRPANIKANPNVFKKEVNDRIFTIGMIAKFTQSKKLKEVLLETGEAELWHIVSRSPNPIRFTYLEKVRDCIRKFDDKIDLSEFSKKVKFNL